MDGLECNNYYETLGISPNADAETIQAVYRFLAKRYHPDNGQTGDDQRFQRVRRAYQILSDPERRSEIDTKVRSIDEHGQRWIQTEGPVGIEEDGYLRKAVLWLLYLCRREDVDRPGLGTLHLEGDLGCSEGELEFHLWCLKEKGWVQRTDSGGFAITADGVDKVTEGVVLRADRLLSKLAGGQEGGPAHGRPFRISGRAAERRLRQA